MEVDVVIVGAGPAGLATAIRLAQLDTNKNIVVLEKGAEVGAHILSGAVIETSSLEELGLVPHLDTPATKDYFYFLTKNNKIKLPTPPQMNNHGNYIISLGKLCRWLAEQAEQLGVQIFPGFPAARVLYENDKIIGIGTKDVGIAKNGSHKDNFQPGINIIAKHTVFAEGARGSLTKQVINKFDLQKDSDPQTYGLGIKELWEIPESQHKPGTVIHTVGWPLDNSTYGGSFIYHMKPNLISIGFVVGLDYTNPFLSPFQEMQRFKLHPMVKNLLQDGKCISYGARVINEGGWQSLPKLSVPGGLLVGCAAGFLNVPKIKGTHLAIKSGIIAAESIFNNTDYQQDIDNSWIASELKSVRNIRPSFQKGLWHGLFSSAIQTYIFNNKITKTKHNHADHLQLKPAKNCKRIMYPKPDGKLTFDRMTSVMRSNVFHEEDQKCHLELKDYSKSISLNLEKFDAPEQRYCPAGVYEIVENSGKKQLQINSQNCIHCKACDIKDPEQNIDWTTPEGGGPNYSEM